MDAIKEDTVELKGIADSPENASDLPVQPPTPLTFIDTTPTSFDFETFSANEKAYITRLRNDVCIAWSISSPSTPFSIKFLPDPDTHNWGRELLICLMRLAEMTRGKYMKQAVGLVESSVLWRNYGLDHSVYTDFMKGDFVIRPSDVEYAMRQMRIELADTFVPEDGHYS